MPTDLVAAPSSVTPLELIQGALSSGTSPEVIRELVALQQSMERFSWEREERQSKIDFDDALRRCQENVGRIAPNRKRENDIWWADYVQLDRVLRPIYTGEGFALVFSESAILRDGKVMIVATLSRSGISREFFQSVTPAGNSKMNAADMEASGQSRAQRYLLLKIFNIAVGIDAEENKPFTSPGLTDIRFTDLMAALEGATNRVELQKAFGVAWNEAKAIGDEGSKKQFQRAYDKAKETI